MSAVAEPVVNEQSDQEGLTSKAEDLPIQPEQDAPRGFFVDPRQVYAKKQVRKNFGDLVELAGSIREHKQKQPCVVFPKDETGKYPLYVGERRWRACLESNQMLWVIEEKDVPSSTDIKIGQLIENIERESLSPVEIGHGIADLIKRTKKRQSEIAEILHVAEKYISIHLTCTKLPPCVEDIFNAGDVTNPDTLSVLKRLYDEDPERCEKLCARASEEQVTRSMAEKALKDVKDTKAKVEAEQNKEKQASFGNAEQEADRQHQKELKETGLNEESEHMELDEAGEGADPDGELDLEDPQNQASCPEGDDSQGESRYPEPQGKVEQEEGTLAGVVSKEGWVEREPQYAAILCQVPYEGEDRRGILALDRYDPDQSMMWVRVTIDTDEIYTRVPASDIRLIKIIS